LLLERKQLNSSQDSHKKNESTIAKKSQVSLQKAVSEEKISVQPRVRKKRKEERKLELQKNLEKTDKRSDI
jgi:hypothetical protein